MDDSRVREETLAWLARPMDVELPRSILPPRTLAPILVVGLGVALVLEMVTMVDRRDASGWAAVLFAPIIGATVIAAMCAAGRVKRAVATFFLTVAVQLAGALFIVKEGFLWVVAVVAIALFAAAVLAAFTPIFVAAKRLGARDEDLETGDLLLAIGGVWLAVASVLAGGFVRNGSSAADLGPSWIGAGLGVVLAAFAIARCAARRRWLARVSRGEIAGLRVRALADHEAMNVPALFGTRADARAVVERLATGDATAYRDGVVGAPLATVPLELTAS